ncbi:GNAT family N-acetyltransferase [Cytobacillus gottheilii]|uniref:GNAT family N-acetyltransferase n=1 Tax=Cytobacillus gottheilii TaxID=859144 RepID=A0ABX8FE60_9BACI|nr:GNAT family N-acetyltransferase [Cytobacillus gottheilii]QVY62303.1 GNAT family N-acetyltransferase [Cytobacillus gottheilii]
MIRTIKAEDSMEIAVLLWEIFEDMELPLLQEIPQLKLMEMVAEAAKDPSYRYGVNRGLVYEHNGEIAGAIFGYPALEELSIDEPFRKVLQKHGFNPDKSLFIDQEALPNEWYLDSIVVNKAYRGMGIGTLLLKAMCQTASDAGFERIGLNVDVANPKAKKLYSSIGFIKVADITLSGHHYEHLCKPLEAHAKA